MTPASSAAIEPARGQTPSSRWTYTPESLASLVIVGAAYVAAARVGLTLDAVSGFATLVWPASGIALAALLLGGYRLVPAITLGAFIANYWTGAPVLAALGIAFGNTMEAIVGTYLLRRVPGFRPSLDRMRDVIALIVLAAGLSTTVSATIGVTTLVLADLVTTAEIGRAWRAWWIGDAIGDLLTAPLILVWTTLPPGKPRLSRVYESAALGLTIMAACAVVFGLPDALAENTRGREYMLFPPLIWAALRFGVRGAVTAVVLVGLVAIAQSAIGRGPFVRSELHESLLALQTFMGISGVTFLVLGASVSERRRVEKELRLARETAEAANRAKAGFLAVVSHELRTPLNAITGYVDLLALEVEGPLNEKQRAVLDRITHSQRHLLSLIDDVLGFAQVEAGRISFALQPVCVHEALKSVESIVGAEAKRKQLALHVAECPADLRVEADPDRLRQILLNLVTNSMKFTLAGGTIELTAEPVGDKVRINVRDTGIGIAEQHVHRVFDPFYQVDQGGTRRYPGLGLGLSIVRDAVLAMNGDVAIESEVGKGTTVSLVLPATPPVTLLG